MHPIKDALADQLASALARDTHQRSYALVDGALQPKAWASLSRRFHVASLLPHATDGGKNAAAALPFLVHIEGAQLSTALRLTIDLALENYAATWLQSPLLLQDLATHLAQRLQGEVPDMEVVLRFADARVLPTLRAVLEPAQARPYFAGIAGWWYLGRDFQLAQLDLPDSAQVSPASGTYVPPLVLTDKQESRLMEAAEPDAVIALLAQHHGHALDKISKAQQYRFAQENIRAARGWGMTSPADHALFCMIALEQSPEQMAEAPWQQALQQVKSKRISLMQALEQMTT